MEDSGLLLRVKLHGLGVSPDNQGFVVLLISEDVRKVLPIVIGHYEAQAIVMELERTTINRPLTHDLLRNALLSSDIKISKVVIDKIKNSTYYAKLFLKTTDREWYIDSRPSDSICLALKAQAPLFVSEELMETCGQDIDVEKKEPETDFDRLRKKLNEAVENEDFEEAAKLRDQLREKFSLIKRHIKEEDEPN